MRACGHFLALPCLLLAAGCREAIPVLAPYALQADQIARLSWILFAVAGAIFLIVAAATSLAILAPATIRGALATPRAVIIGGIVFPAIVLSALLVSNISLLHSLARAPADQPDVVPIVVVGEQWWWRVTYDVKGVAVPAANEIRIPIGRDVLFTLRSADVIHSFWVPSLGGKVDMIPGRDTRLRVHATRPGVFRGPCAEYCGGPHALMALQVIAMPADEFDAWVANEASPARLPAGETERRGQALFLSSGCGACHAVRGTSAAGVVGPDLTRVGARATIAAGSLTLSHAHLARFITEGQSIKPGNTMPEFRIFSDDQRDALAAYLLSLK